MVSEFELIDRFFTRPTPTARLGVGDDAAVVEPEAGCDLVMTVDTMVSGRHFAPDVAARALGHKCLAVNLSDIAAMGARPRWALLAITLPEVDEGWLGEFANGFHALARSHGVDLVGGDTTRGPLSITVTVIGEVSRQRALRRATAQPGDEVWVSGQIGSAALALGHRHGELRLKGNDLEACNARLDMPLPRVELGQALSGIASSAIDISDGLVAEARHIAASSGMAIELEYESVPVVPGVMHLKQDQLVRNAVLSGGDDYELLFTVPVRNAENLDSVSARLGLSLTRIGRVTGGSGVKVLDASGAELATGSGGYDHFA